MPSTELQRGAELGRVSSFTRSSAAGIHEPDTVASVEVNAPIGNDDKRHCFLSGFRRWSLVIAVLLSMLLLGLDNTIVATVSVPSVLRDFTVLLTTQC